MMKKDPKIEMNIKKLKDKKQLEKNLIVNVLEFIF